MASSVPVRDWKAARREVLWRYLTRRLLDDAGCDDDDNDDDDNEDDDKDDNDDKFDDKFEGEFDDEFNDGLSCSSGTPDGPRGPAGMCYHAPSCAPAAAVQIGGGSGGDGGGGSDGGIDGSGSSGSGRRRQ